MSRALQAGEANTSAVEASVRRLTVAGLDCAAPHPPVSSHRRVEARARPGPSALPRNSYSPCQTAQFSSFPRRVSAPGFCFPLFHPPPEGRAERRKAQYFRCRAFSARDGTVPNEARRASSGTRSPLRRSTVAILGRGPRFLLRHFLRIRRASSSQPGRSAWRAGSRTSRGRRLRAAAAGRHSPPGLQDRL